MIGAFGTVTKGLLKGLEDLKVGGLSEHHPNNSIIENSQNTEKSSGDLRRLDVTQSPLMWKTLMSNNDNNYNNVTVIPIAISALGPTLKDLVKEKEELGIGRRAETIQTTAFILARILKRDLGTWGDLLPLRVQR